MCLGGEIQEVRLGYEGIRWKFEGQTKGLDMMIHRCNEARVDRCNEARVDIMYSSMKGYECKAWLLFLIYLVSFSQLLGVGPKVSCNSLNLKSHAT